MIHDFQIEMVALGNGIIIGHAGAAQWIHPQVNLAVLNRLHIHHRREIVHIGVQKAMRMGGGGFAGPLKRDSRHPLQSVRPGRRWPAVRSIGSPGYPPDLRGAGCI